MLVEFDSDHSIDLARNDWFLSENELWWPPASILNAALKGKRTPELSWTKEIVEILSSRGK